MVLGDQLAPKIIIQPTQEFVNSFFFVRKVLCCITSELGETIEVFLYTQVPLSQGPELVPLHLHMAVGM